MSTLHEAGREHWTEEQLREIAGLIYDTDPYIYPVMFSDRKKAQKVITGMFRERDSMFSFSNLFTATEGEKVHGIILWNRGPLNWSPEIYYQCGGDSPFITEVKEGYFDSYKETATETVSLVNVCVSESVRGKGLGKKMIEAFLQTVPGPYELVVLKDNPAAVHLYEKLGFKVIKEIQGFSIPKRDLPVLLMERPG